MELLTLNCNQNKKTMITTSNFYIVILITVINVTSAVAQNTNDANTTSTVEVVDSKSYDNSKYKEDQNLNKEVTYMGEVKQYNGSKTTYCIASIDQNLYRISFDLEASVIQEEKWVMPGRRHRKVEVC